MSLEQRKQKFIKLLQDLLEQRGGVKSKLAQELGISPARFTNWFQGKVDPGGLDIATFKQIAQAKNCSVEQLTQLLGFMDIEEESLARFRQLLQNLLLDKTQEELAERLGIDQTTISKWLNLEQTIDLTKISTKIMFSISREKGWTLDKLFDYLKLNSNNSDNDIPLNYQSDTNSKFEYRSNLNISLLLEKENIAIASNYASNLAIHLNLKPENIQVTTIPKLPYSLADIDVLIFDISSADSASIALIKDLKFEGNIVVFAAADLPQEVLTNLSNQVTEVVVKPIDWKNLKDKEYLN